MKIARWSNHFFPIHSPVPTPFPIVSIKLAEAMRWFSCTLCNSLVCTNLFYSQFDSKLEQGVTACHLIWVTYIVSRKTVTAQDTNVFPKFLILNSLENLPETFLTSAVQFPPLLQSGVSHAPPETSVVTLWRASCWVAISMLLVCMDSDVTSRLDICRSHLSTSCSSLL